MSKRKRIRKITMGEEDDTRIRSRSKMGIVKGKEGLRGELGPREGSQNF